MTTAKNPKVSSRFRLPDPPEREPDEKMTSVKHPGRFHHPAFRVPTQTSRLLNQVGEWFVDNQPGITPGDFFSNAAAREAGFTVDFWYQAYQLYLDEAGRDPGPSLEKYDRPRTVRMPFKQGYVDVVASVQPEPREYRIVRFTAFPAEGEG